MIKHFYIFLFLTFSACAALAQNPKNFDEMARKMKGKSDTVGITTLKKWMETEKIAILDTREEKEYTISHIPKAKYYGYDKPNKDILKDIPKDAVIITYCSVGYRSGKVAEDLKKQGYKYVYNFYGGIFNWANNGELIHRKAIKTNEIHGYNKSWSKWVNTTKLKLVL
ncbi:MAG: rhodanese-like domain-containing protein [Flavobacteriales bacterium]